MSETKEKVKVRMVCGEDSAEIQTAKGVFVCRVNRDDDSGTAAQIVLEALGFEVELVDE